MKEEVIEIRSYRKELEEQLLELRELIKKSNRNLGRYKDLPESHVYISRSNGSIQYYLKNKGEPKQYIAKKNIKNILKYAQRDYEKEMNDKLIKFENELTLFLQEYNPEMLEEYDFYSEAKQRLIKPLTLSEKEYVDEWYRLHPGMQNIFPIEQLFYTNCGEKVRSKSEKIIADTLEKFNIPYQYEPMLELGYGTVYPDFVALNKRTGRTVYWEHLGILSDYEYASKNFRKIQSYEKNRILLGRDLIVTMESSDMPIDVKLVEEKIIEFLI